MKKSNFWLGFAAALAGAGWLFLQRQQAEAPEIKLRSARKDAVREEPDPFTDIQGIGPVFARRLHAAGVYTFAQLAAVPPERLRQLAGARPGLADVDSWIEQARARSHG